MTTINIDPATFRATGRNYRGNEVGTVLVSGMERTAVRSTTAEGGVCIQVAGYVGRYRTSPKAWPASLTLYHGRVFAHFGRDDRSGRFNKINGISYEPETFARIANAKYFEAVAE